MTQIRPTPTPNRSQKPVAGTPNCDQIQTRPRWTTAGACVGAGLLLAASLPPFGWWPLAFAGVALLDRLVADQPAGARFRRGWLVGIALIGPTMFWLKDMTAPGYVIAVVFFSLMLGGATALCPPAAGRRLALPAAWVLAEALRGSWPFGGTPMSILAIGQAGGPLAQVARLGGTLLLGATTVSIGVGLSALAARSWRVVSVVVVAVAAVVLLSVTASSGFDTGSRLSVGYVQGGGPQGTRATDTDPRVVFERHLRASGRVPQGLDLTVWPEDVVDTEAYVVDTKEGRELADLARRLGTTLIAGVVEDEGTTQFRNASMVWGPDGTVLDRYEKVHRVPFGEWVPFRSLLEPFAGDALPPRDAVIGKGPATLSTPRGTLGVMISWEVFFGNRARDAVRYGGEVLINPTNGSSFTGTLVQTQQVASSRLRAIETGRWVVQVAPTGFSAFVTPDGRVLQRSDISDPAVAVQQVDMRRGLTPYTRLGDRPYVLLAVAAVAGAWALDRFRGRRRPAP